MILKSILSICLLALVAEASLVSLKTPLSTFTGRLQSNQESNVLVLHSIPYAQPPTGSLRFQPPQPLADFPVQLDASQLPATCMQMPHMKTESSKLLNFDTEHRTSEDCLYLSIYVPLQPTINNQTVELTSEQLQTAEQKQRPVLVWLAGEGFDFADARQFDGVRLASESNSIVVAIQYRVGVFGFLKADQLSNGNQGIWDQVQALEWLQQNLQHFGGNADQVTLMGRFTGAMSISILLTSPLLADRHLFNRAALLSGIATGNWVFDRRPTEKVYQLINQLNCTTKINTAALSSKSNATEIFNQKINECLLNEPATSLLAASSFGWKPVIDGKLIVGQPIDLLESGQFSTKVSDILLGSTENDGSICYQIQRAIRSQQAEDIDNGKLSKSDFRTLVKQDLSMFFEDEEQENQIFELIRPDENKSDQTAAYINFCSQLLIHSHQNRFAQLLSARTNVITYKLHSSMSNFTSRPSTMSGAGFGDDILLLFAQLGNSNQISQQDKLMAKHFNELIGAFVANGAAELSRLHLNSNDQSALEIDLLTQLESSAKDLSSILQFESNNNKFANIDLNQSTLERRSFIGCQLVQSSVHSLGQNLLDKLFQAARSRQGLDYKPRIVCDHLDSKSDFLTVLRQSNQQQTNQQLQAAS